MQLPEAFLSRMQALIGDDLAAYQAAMETQPRRALRVNTLKISPEELLVKIPSLEKTGLCAEGFLVPEDFSPGKDIYHAAGLYYMQEASAQYPASLAAGLSEGDFPVVLDLCAAPGGKSTQLAAQMGNRGLLIANEPVWNRCGILADNFERLGVTNGLVTCMMPQDLCPLISGLCDLILVDAPCSGEGMFRKEPEAIQAWSPAHVEACAQRQANILDSAVEALRPGGRLIYSTCTFSREENEGVVETFLKKHPDFSLLSMDRFYPHTCPGEGQFAALLLRDGDATVASEQLLPTKGNRIPEWEQFQKESLALPLDRPAQLLKDGRIVLPPAQVPRLLSSMRIRIAGIPAGELRPCRFQPGHGLSHALKAEAFFNRLEVSYPEAVRFLSGETLSLSAASSGWTAVTFEGHVLGLGKAVGNALKNHYPKGLRLR